LNGMPPPNDGNPPELRLDEESPLRLLERLVEIPISPFNASCTADGVEFLSVTIDTVRCVVLAAISSVSTSRLIC
jgi:hypothetical protein